MHIPFATLCDGPVPDDPSVRPPPLTDVIPRDSLLRKSISDWTSLPIPREAAGDLTTLLARRLSVVSKSVRHTECGYESSESP